MSQADWDVLDHFLPAARKTIRGVEGIDGFFTALQCAPHPVPAGEAIWAVLSDGAIDLARQKGELDRLSRQVVNFVHELRRKDLFKLPGVAETLDWTRALTTLDCLEITPEVINDTLGTLLKYQDDIVRIRGSEAARLLEEVTSRTRHVELRAEGA